ncbi:hypothetical protein SGPA1_60011 [Streptomyces misionensis JCM 4497]
MGTTDRVGTGRLDRHAVDDGEQRAEGADDEDSGEPGDDEALALLRAEGVAQRRRTDALLRRAPDRDAEAEQDGDGHHHLDHHLGLVAQAAEGPPVRSDPADDGVDVSLVGRKEHVSHRPWWVVPRVLCGVQRSGLIVADNVAVVCRLDVIDWRVSYEYVVRSLCVSRQVTPGNEVRPEPAVWSRR